MSFNSCDQLNKSIHHEQSKSHWIIILDKGLQEQQIHNKEH